MLPSSSSPSGRRRTPIHVLPSFDRSHPHVLTLTLARPPVNAFSRAFWQELRQAVDEVDRHEHEVRVVVLRSAVDKAFTAGIDLSELTASPLSGITQTGTRGTGTGIVTLDGSSSSSSSSREGGGQGGHPHPDPARTALELRDFILDFQDALSSLARCRLPIIVAVHGLCLGLGLDLIAAADVRLCSESCTFAIREAALGLAADIGVLQRLPKTTGNDSLVRELALTARFFDSATADRLGLVSRVVPGGKAEVEREALRVADEIAALSPIATLGTKHLHARDHTVGEGLAYTALWNAAMLQTDDLRQAAAATAAGRAVGLRRRGQASGEGGGPPPEPVTFRPLRKPTLAGGGGGGVGAKL